MAIAAVIDYEGGEEHWLGE
ncbi:hypothetical protein CGLO_14690 [Colletotrichum gloeosporioides Cg-14]|uniref:Uncharacterized protein n=1 Tax=Colletotrichum gloeosporioides (strain Cg-14) TaxID=1237896 RepID=T0JT35_COLGC|nr:hypothetical protein CGLO_14690 [Colletotrichum gloeosporioides Cg-14]